MANEQETMDAAIAALSGEGTEEPAGAAPEDGAQQPQGQASEGVAKPAAAEQPAPAEDDSKTSLWRRITDQDREIRALKQQFKTPPKAQGESVEDLKRLASENPKEFIERMGLSFDKVFDAWSNDLQAESERPSKGSPQADPAIVKEIQELKQKLSSYEEQQRQSASQQFHMREISAMESQAAKDESRWALVNKAKDDGSLELAFQVAVKMYQTNGQVPDHGYVLDCVEEQLRSQAQKFSSWIGATAPPKATPVQSQPRAAESAPTLSGAQGEDTPVPKKLSDDELFQLALAELEKGTN